MNEVELNVMNWMPTAFQHDAKVQSAYAALMVSPAEIHEGHGGISCS